MDLGFSLLWRERRRPIRPVDLGVLIADVVARQAASATGRVQARLGTAARPAPGSFNPAVAALLAVRQPL